MNNNFSYEDYCRIVGDLYLNSKAQENHFKTVLNSQIEQIAALQKEIRTLKTQCNILKENI